MAQYKEDLEENTNYGQANLRLPTLPNTKITDANPYAFVVQKTSIPDKFKGVVNGDILEGSKVIDPYLKPYRTRLDDLEFAVLGALTEEADPIALAAIDELKKRITTIENSSRTSSRIESVSLGTLQAKTWTAFPAASGAIEDFKIFDSVGNDISSLLETRRSASGWQVFSLVRQENLVFEYEIAQTGSNIQKNVLPSLPAKTWTSLPAVTGTAVDYKIFDSDTDISDLLDVRRINGIYQAYSLVDKVNLQIEYEIGV